MVEIHQPDGKPDMLQQIEHGALSIVGGYRSLGRLYRGIIEPTLPQYMHLGDRHADRQPGLRPEDAGEAACRRWASRARPTTAGCSPRTIRGAN